MNTITCPNYLVLMKKVLITLCLASLLPSLAAAQIKAVTLELTPNGTPNTNEDFCVDVTTLDWSTIINIETFFSWDPGVIQFTGIQNFNTTDLPSLDLDDFDASAVEQGVLYLKWDDIPCDGEDTNLGDGTRIFSICFRAIGNYAASTEIYIPQDTTATPGGEFLPRAIKKTNCFSSANAGLTHENGIISIGVRPLQIIGERKAAFTGTQTCVGYSVSGFDDILGLQFSVNWDPSQLRFVSVNSTDQLPNLGPGSFGRPDFLGGVQPGQMTVQWLSPAIINAQGISLADDTEIFKICYDVIGECETTTEIVLSNEPTEIQITNDLQDPSRNQGLASYNLPGAIEMGECDPTGLNLTANCNIPFDPNNPIDSLKIGDQICVAVSSDNFEDIASINHIIEWNEDILTYRGVRNTIEGAFDIGSTFDENNVGNGILGYEFDAPGGRLSLAGNVTLYEVCFEVTGYGGNSPFNFSGTPNLRAAQIGDPNYGINPSSCIVEIPQPQGVTMSIPGGSGRPGDEVCLGISVNNFQNIESADFALGWDNRILSFKSAELNNQLNGAVIQENETFYGVRWTSNNGAAASIDDGGTIVTLCFDVVGEPLDCDSNFGNDVLAISNQVTTTESGGEPIAIEKILGEVCVQFPEGFFLDIGRDSGFVRDTVCIPVSATGFQDITQTNFSLSWDPVNLFYAGVQNLNTDLITFNEGNFDESSSDVGLLSVNWSNPAGETLADSTTLFDLCFEPIGEADECFEVSLSDSPESDVTLLNNVDGDISSTPGEVCVKDTILVEALVNPVTCPDTEDGEIELFISGGRGPYLINWDLRPSPPQFGPRATSLSQGMKILSIFDASNPPITYRDTFMIGISEEVPIADAGPDVMLTCTESTQLASLSGGGSTGPIYRYRWASLDGGTIMGTDTTQNVVVNSPGQYLFEVTNRQTGCFDRDTVEVMANLPIADAGDDFGYTCNDNIVRMNGTGSSSDQNVFSYSWEALDGGFILSDPTDVTIEVNSPGTYVITVRNTIEGCIATDTARIVDLREPVPANAGPDQAVGCIGDTLLLDPVAEPGAFDYRWLDIDGMLLAQGTTYPTADTGRFILQVTEEATGCIGQDTVQVFREIREIPIDAEALTVINCIKDTATVRVNLPPDSGPLQILWEPVGDGIVVEDENLPEAIVGAVGVYRVTVTNPENNCSNTDEVEVTEVKTEPIAEAGESVTLGCDQPSIVLDGAGSSVGNDFTYFWFRGDTSEVSNSMDLEVRLAGTYYIRVTDTSNGCEARDSVVINVNDDVPTIEINPPTDVIDCLNNEVSIFANPPTLANFDLEWVARGDTGIILSGLNDLSIRVGAPGTYQVMIQDLDNNCVGFNEVIVGGNLAPPTIELADQAIITCETPQTTIQGVVTGTDNPDASINYAWSALDNTGQIVGSSNLDSVIVNQIGLYELRATDLFNGCISMDTIEVTADTTLPVVIFELLDGSLGCGDTLVAIDASNSFRDSPATIEWNRLDGGNETIFTTANQLIVEVSEPGRYELLITNDETGCQARDSIEVQAEVPEINIVFANDTPREGCPDQSAILDATPSQIGALFQARWTPLDVINSVVADPDNPLLATASGAGSYELFISLGGSCESRDTITVLPSDNLPEAIVVTDQVNIECGETASLDGTGSSVGAEFAYQWIDAQSRLPLENGDGLITTTMQNGSYVLLVTNTFSNCVDSAQVTVNVNTDGLPVADAGMDETLCETESILSATDPGPGIVGTWTTSTGAVIETPTINASSVSGLQSGPNVFTWTLSSEGCGDYDSDDVVITVSDRPTAVNDQITISVVVPDTTLNLLSNDNVNNVPAFTLRILSDPSLGSLSNIDTQKGTVRYSTSSATGIDEFTYELCSVACRNLCDTATVQVTINEVIIDKNAINQPNGITPNGDGLNETLFFDILDEFPRSFPDNQMIIFNRWMDVVYESEPYQNEWRGTNNSGQDLPAGTYYYILRLDLAEGIILRGDVTIIR